MEVCIICFEKRRSDEFISTSCGCRACSDCHLHWARSQLEQTPAVLRCPMPQCMTPLSTTDLLSVLDQDTQEQLEEAQTLSLIRSSPEYRHCPVCNTPGFASTKQRHFLCLHCHKCWQEAGLQLANPIQLLVTLWSELQSNLWKRVVCKQCPSCSAFIEKNEGCKHMECFKCGYEFCWLCFQEWKTHLETPCTGFLPDVFPVFCSIVSLIFSLKCLYTAPILLHFLLWLTIKAGIILGITLNSLILSKIIDLSIDSLSAVRTWKYTGQLQGKKYPLTTPGSIVYVGMAVVLEIPAQFVVLSVANTGLWMYVSVLMSYLVVLGVEMKEIVGRYR